jgi:autotransporter-associated beta strand protein
MFHKLWLPTHTASLVLLCACAPGLQAFAGVKEDVGLVTLQAEIGDLPTGAGVRVGLIEAAFDGSYRPMEELPEFAGKHFEFRSGISGNSAHATAVAQNFFGLSTSIAPGIDTIEVYAANGYLGPGFLRPGTQLDPLSSPQNSRVGNHSWVHSMGSIEGNLDVLQRQDWVIERDDYIQVVGVNNGSVNMNPLLSNAFNAIAVGRSDGEHAINSLNLGGVYPGYRAKPDIVAPMTVTSLSTPVVAAAAALLVQTGHSNYYLSNGSYTARGFAGSTINHAETSEVVKAALLAGASRLAFNSTDGSAMLDYRAVENRQAANGLDKRYGAGQLNVHNSHFIVSSGEQDSLSDGRFVDVQSAGFDYDPHFGGANGSNATGTYDFTAGWTGQTLTASLVWNAKIDIEKVKQNDYANAATLYDLNLSLYDITSGTPALIAASASGKDNSENLWTSLVGGHRYRIEVSRPATQAPFDWDYGLAWSTVGTIGWRGTDMWDTNSSPSWVKGSSPARFLPGAHVVFNDSALSGLVYLAGSVAPGSVTIDNGSMPYAFLGGGITGATGLVKRGSGQAVLTATNTYAGPTRVEAGRLGITTNGALGTAARPTTVSAGAALVLQGPLNYWIPEPLTIAGHGPSGQGALENVSGDNVFSGPVTPSGNATIGVTSGSLELTGSVQLPTSTSITKNGAGALLLAGSLDLGPSSALAVTGGTLRLEPTTSAAIAVSAQSPAVVIAGGRLELNAQQKDPLTDSQYPSRHANVQNDVLGGLVIEAGSVGVDEIVGLGSTIVGDGATLTIDGIDQSGLSIGDGGLVAVRPGQTTALRLNSLILEDGPSLSSDITGAGSSRLQKTTFSQDPAWRGPATTLRSTAAIPEPGTALLVLVSVVIATAAFLRRRRARDH